MSFWKKESMLRSVFMLTIVCLIAAALLGTAFVLTKPKIDEQTVSILNENLKQVMPDADNFEESDGYYIAKKGNNIIGYVAIAESQGYSSVIMLLVGINLDKEITSIRILDQQETPGLGDNSKKPEFYGQFTGLKEEDISLKKEGGKIDAITGATITSRAVIDGVRSALEEKLLPLIGSDKEKADEENLTSESESQINISTEENNNNLTRDNSTEKSSTDLANPASVHCVDNGGSLEFITNENGTYGVCILPDGTKCEEWSFYRGDCPENESQQEGGNV